MSVQLESVPKELGWKDIELRKSPSPDIFASSDDKFLLTNAPPSLRYIPNFITEEEERELIEKIQAIPVSEWIDDPAGQRKIDCGKIPKGYGSTEFDHRELPSWTNQVIDRALEFQHAFSDIPRTDHFRVNEYQPGKGLMPHLDFQICGPLNSVVTLGSSCLLDFYYPPPEGMPWSEMEKHEELYIGSVFMEPRSLFFLSDEMFTKMFHGIKSVKEDLITNKVFNRPENLPIGSVVPRGLRYSMTARYTITFPHAEESEKHMKSAA